MNLSRTLAKSLSSNPTKWTTLLRPSAFLQSSFLSSSSSNKKNQPIPESDPEPEPESEAQQPVTEGAWRREAELTHSIPVGPFSPPKKASQFRRPSEIPYQAKIANKVHLVGNLAEPIQLRSSQDGIYAVSVLVQQKQKEDSQLRIPITFQGDLAEIVASHFKESDLVYVTGQLSEDPPSLTVKENQPNIQVLADNINFVRKDWSEEKFYASSQLGTVKKPYKSTDGLWRDLLRNPQQWRDNRVDKKNGLLKPKYPDFSSKDTKSALWLDSAPDFVTNLDGLVFCCSNDERKYPKEDNISTDSLWRDLRDNPQQWRDNRVDKKNGLLKPKYPDFTNKDTKSALWLESAPDWVPDLDSIDATPKSDKEILWKSLVENPQAWWDNRLKKINPKGPDFKHKESGEVLWLNSSPSWVLEKLPPAVDMSIHMKRDRETINFVN